MRDLRTAPLLWPSEDEVKEDKHQYLFRGQASRIKEDLKKEAERISFSHISYQAAKYRLPARDKYDKRPLQSISTQSKRQKTDYAQETYNRQGIQRQNFGERREPQQYRGRGRGGRSRGSKVAGREFRKIWHLVTSFCNFAWCYIWVYCFQKTPQTKWGSPLAACMHTIQNGHHP